MVAHAQVVVAAAPRPSMGPAHRIPRRAGGESFPAAGCRFATRDALPAVVFSSEQAECSPGAIAHAATVDGNSQAVGAARATGHAPGHCAKTVAPHRNRPSFGNVSRPSVSPPGVCQSPRDASDARRGTAGHWRAAGDWLTGRRSATGPASAIDPDWQSPRNGGRPIIGGGQHRNRPGGEQPVTPSIARRQHQHRQHRQPPGGNNNFVNININRPGWGLGRRRQARPLGRPLVQSSCSSTLSRLVSRLLERALGQLLVRADRCRCDGVGPECLAALVGLCVRYLPTPTRTTLPSAAPVYDYSQPIVINNYDTPADDASADSAYDRNASRA